jgi:hypothetical protein
MAFSATLADFSDPSSNNGVVLSPEEKKVC